MQYIVRAVESRLDHVGGYGAQIPEVKVLVDRQRKIIGHFIKALAEAGNDACVQMEDDVVLCDNFKERIETEIAKHPEALIQFFSMRKKDIDIGSRWDNNFINLQCFYLPPTYARQICEWFPRTPWDYSQDEIDGADSMMDDWLKSRKEKYWICVPNLVNHVIGSSVIDKRRFKNRVSKTFKKEAP